MRRQENVKVSLCPFVESKRAGADANRGDFTQIRFELLPNDILYEVLSYLDPSDLFLTISLLNKR